MIKLDQFDELRPEEILNRDIRAEKNVEDVVDGILADVRARGDAALKEYALKFDGASIEELQVTQAEIDAAFANMDPYFLETLKEAAANIEAFHTGLDIEPHSGGRLFRMDARLRLPPGLAAADVQAALEDISAEIMVDIALTPAEPE